MLLQGLALEERQGCLEALDLLDGDLDHVSFPSVIDAGGDEVGPRFLGIRLASSAPGCGFYSAIQPSSIRS